MAEMTMTEAVEMLRGLIPDEGAVQIDDGAQMWDASALVDAVRERDDGEVHDLAVNDEGISRVRPDGTIESVRIYQVRPRPTVARLAADLRGLGVPEQRIRGLLQWDGLRCGICGRVVEIVDSDSETVYLACPAGEDDHTEYRIDF